MPLLLSVTHLEGLTLRVLVVLLSFVSEKFVFWLRRALAQKFERIDLLDSFLVSLIFLRGSLPY